MIRPRLRIRLRIRLRGIAASLLSLAFAGCGALELSGGPAFYDPGRPPPPPCSTESDCSGNQICFPDGCGDPGEGVVVEVTANARSGHLPQDLVIDAVKPELPLEVSGPIALAGTVRRAARTGTSPYKGAVRIQAVGASNVIPGLLRRYEAQFPSLEQGKYSMFVGAATYTLTVTAVDDAAIPAVRIPEVRIDAGGTRQDIVFAAQSQALVLVGRVIKQGPTPPFSFTDQPLTQAGTAVELQAVDPATQRPLSQRTAVSSGFTGSTGDFRISIDPAAKNLPAFNLVVTPKEPGAPVPSKVFELKKPYPQEIVLEVGDFGEVIRDLSGKLHDPSDQPVAGASVYFEGPVNGGGTYKSATVTTDAQGNFKVTLLPTANGEQFTLVATPPAQGASGRLRATAVAHPAGILSSPRLEPSDFRTPPRVKIMGTITSAKGDAAVDCRVVAVPLEAVDGRPLPIENVEARADDTGAFSLALDPAFYRFDFLPSSGTPRRSRLAAVRSQPAPDGKSILPVDLGPTELLDGRKVSGTVTVRSASNEVNPAPNASVRFFRVTTVDGKPSAILLDESLADYDGKYTVMLPTK